MVSFWGTVANIQDASSHASRFPTIAKLIKSLLSLPHLNADIERLFSQVTLIKTKERNKLKTSTVDALLMVKQSLPCSCATYNPDPSICKCINVEMYNSDSSESEQD